MKDKLCAMGVLYISIYMYITLIKKHTDNVLM